MISQKLLFDKKSIVTVKKNKKTTRLLVMDGGERQNYVKVWDSATDTAYPVSFDDFINIPNLSNFADIPFAKKKDGLSVVLFQQDLRLRLPETLCPSFRPASMQ
jgi:hypothetical protein